MVSSEAIRFARGTVWWCEDPLGQNLPGVPGVQAGRRPALVVSSNESYNSPSVEVVKLTLTDKSHTCPTINIPSTYGSTTSYILCNQHFTVNTSQLVEYMYTLSEETMNKVDSALLTAQGFHYLIKVKDFLNRSREDTIDQITCQSEVSENE